MFLPPFFLIPCTETMTKGWWEGVGGIGDVEMWVFFFIGDVPRLWQTRIRHGIAQM